MTGPPSPPQAGEQALAGLRVVEFTAGMAGPWIGRFMAWCGAEVIRVESKRHPDVLRLYVSPREPERGTQPQCSPWFTDWNGGKRFVSLDLTQPRGLELARRLVAISDVVVENYSAGVLDKLGLGYADLRRWKSDLVMISSSGFGDSGPNRSYVTWGPNIEALAGLATLSGFPERPCTMTQFAYPDPVSALHGLVAVMAALDHRERTGEGQYVSLSQFEATAAVIGPLLMQALAEGDPPAKLGNRSLRGAPHGCYRCLGDDRWCAIEVHGQEEWEAFRTALGSPPWSADPRFATPEARRAHAEALDAHVEAWTGQRSAEQVMQALQAGGVAAGVVQTAEDLLQHDPQLRARGFFEEVEHLAKGRELAAGVPLGLTGTPGRTGRTGAALGQDNAYVFGELLGLTAAELRECEALGALERADS
jgi:crotonobetainyl-CoA:carnitine CoA-transferase CaiB-like acyl-CoA transferase